MDSDNFLAAIGQLELPISEVHGVLTGFLCAGGLWEDASDEELEVILPNTHGRTVRGLLDEVNSQLSALTLDFTPLVLDDEHPMAERLAALSEWCGGYLAGYGLGVGDERLEPAASEMLSDLLAIAELDPDDEDSEENEVDFAEVYEFARIVAMTMHGASSGGSGSFFEGGAGSDTGPGARRGSGPGPGRGARRDDDAEDE